MDKNMKVLIDQKAQKIADLGDDMTNTDLYDLCVLNKLREVADKDELDKKETV